MDSWARGQTVVNTKPQHSDRHLLKLKLYETFTDWQAMYLVKSWHEYIIRLSVIDSVNVGPDSGQKRTWSPVYHRTHKPFTHTLVYTVSP